MASVQARIAEELGVREQQVEAAVDLLDGGATVPFIARYRKEATGALDDAQLRTLEERLVICASWRSGARPSSTRSASRASSTPRSKRAILAADSKARLEDIYLPYKPKRRTKARDRQGSRARAARRPAAGATRSNDPHAAAEAFVDAEKERRRRRGRARRRARHPGRALRRGRRPDRRAARGAVVATGAWPRKVRDGKKERGRQVQRLFRLRRAARPSCRRTASWRCSAARRRKSSTSRSSRTSPRPPPQAVPPAPTNCASCARFGIADRGRPGDRWLIDTVRWAWRTKIHRASRHRPAAAAVDGGRGRGGARVRRQSARPAARRARRHARRRWASIRASAPASRSRWSTRPARWWRPTRSIRTSRSGAGTRRSRILAKLAREHQRRADRDRQRHRLARDRQARDRAGQAACRS